MLVDILLYSVLGAAGLSVLVYLIMIGLVAFKFGLEFLKSIYED